MQAVFSRRWRGSVWPWPPAPPPPRGWAARLSAPVSRMSPSARSCSCPAPRARSSWCRRRCRSATWSPSTGSGSWKGPTCSEKNKIYGCILMLVFAFILVLLFLFRLVVITINIFLFFDVNSLFLCFFNLILLLFLFSRFNTILIFCLGDVVVLNL